MVTSLNIVQIIISAALITLLLMQAKGGSLNRVLGGDIPVHKTRRGLEKTVFNLTLGLSVVFVLVSVLSVLVKG